MPPPDGQNLATHCLSPPRFVVFARFDRAPKDLLLSRQSIGRRVCGYAIFCAAVQSSAATAFRTSAIRMPVIACDVALPSDAHVTYPGSSRRALLAKAGEPFARVVRAAPQARRRCLPAPRPALRRCRASINCLVSCTDTGARRQMSAARPRAPPSARRRRDSLLHAGRCDSASSALMRRPVSARYFTRVDTDQPGSRCVPDQPGHVPMRRLGQAECARRSLRRGVRGGGQLQSATERMAVDRRNHRLAQPRPLVEHLMAALGPGSATCRAARAPTTR